MKLHLIGLLAILVLATQAQAFVGGGALIEKKHQAFQVNSNGVLDLKGRNVCKPNFKEFDKVVECKPGDIVVFYDGSGLRMLTKILAICKMDEPIYYVDEATACVFEDKSDQVKFYRPRPPQKPEEQTEPKPEKERKRKPEKRPWEHVD